MNNIVNWLIYAYIVTLPLVPEKLRFKGISISDALLLSIMLIYFLNLFINKTSREAFKVGIKDFFTEPISLFMFILIAIMITSISYSFEKKLAFTESVRFIFYVCLFFVIKYEIRCKKVIKNFINSYMIVTSILSILGLIQFFTGFALDKKFIFDYKSGATIRIAATLGNPNTYAAFLILALFPLIIVSISEKKVIKKIMFIILSLLVLINIVLTGSRNAILAFAIGFIVLSIIYNWRLIYLFIITAITSFFIPQVARRIREITDVTQNLSRIKIWNTALKMIKEHPLLGVGNGNFVYFYDIYVKKHPELEYPDYKRMPSHNSYLKVQSELGILGMVAFMGTIVAAVLKLINLIKNEQDKFLNLFFKGFIASLISFLFMNFFDNLFFVPKVTAYFWIIISCSQSLSYNLKLETNK